MDRVVHSSDDLAAVLRHYRESRNLSQVEVSARVQMRQATLSSFETAGNGTVRTLFAILDALDLDLVVHPRDASSSDAHVAGHAAATVPTASDGVNPLTIPDAKKALALTVGVPEAAIEITIRG